MIHPEMPENSGNKKGAGKEMVVKPNSSEHSCRNVKLNYLVPPRCKNFYTHYFVDDVSFKVVAEASYLKHIKQRMQEKQKNRLLFEMVLSLENRHTPQDIIDLFQLLNKLYGGHTLVELAIHEDEGYFISKDHDMIFMPGKNILEKDGEWFVANDFTYSKKKSNFTNKIDISKFEIIYNRHAHVKFSKIDLNTGKSSRMAKKDMSKRLQIISQHLGLAYRPEEKKSSRKSIHEIKDAYEEANKILILKKKHEIEMLKQRDEFNLMLKEEKFKATQRYEQERNKLQTQIEEIVRQKKISDQELQIKSEQFESLKGHTEMVIEELLKGEAQLQKILKNEKSNSVQIEKKLEDSHIYIKQLEHQLKLEKTSLKNFKSRYLSLKDKVTQLSNDKEDLVTKNTILEEKISMISQSNPEEFTTIQNKPIIDEKRLEKDNSDNQQFLSERMKQDNEIKSKFKI